MSFTTKKETRGRKTGHRKTSKVENKIILKSFHKLRPPGYYVDSRKVHTSLPKKVRKNISRRTVRRRLAEKGYVPTRKMKKSDPGPRLAKKRFGFSQKHKDKTPADWKAELQAVGDIKEFTWSFGHAPKADAAPVLLDIYEKVRATQAGLCTTFKVV